MNIADNPLLQDWNTSQQLPPFDAIRAEHFIPALEVLFTQHLAEIDALAQHTDAPSFTNTAAAFDASGLRLERATLLLSNLVASASTPALQAVERDTAPLLARHQNQVLMHAGFFQRLDQVHQQRLALELSEEQRRLLERIHTDFVRAGAKLQGEQRQRFAELQTQLAELQTSFRQNLLADEAEYALSVGDDQLDGLPGFALDGARAAAAERKLPGHVFTLSRASVLAFLGFSSQRGLREQLWRAWTSRGEHAERDNRPLARRILALRAELAGLLSYANFADYALANRMAGTPQAVEQLMRQVWEPAKQSCARELELLRAEARRLGEPEDIQPWDWYYLAEKVRQSQYALDDAETKPYFSLDNMIAAMFDVAGRLFDLSFVERAELPCYHPDVRVWEVYRGVELIGVFYGDNFARQGKRSGAWMHLFRQQARNGGKTLPVVINNNNFVKSSHGPTLLSFDDVRTLFHEFGHGMHGLLSDVEYRSLSGPNTPRDYVELPSQLFENWALEPAVLAKHARHADSGEAIPQALIAKILAARSFNQGFETVRYAASTLIDLALHLRNDVDGVDIAAFEAEQRQSLGVPDAVGMNHRPPHFQHIFASDGYAAGYYVYIWAEVLEAEAFAAFKERGDAFDPELADKLRRYIYSAGDSREQSQAFRAFRGRDPDAAAMLRKRGLLGA